MQFNIVFTDEADDTFDSIGHQIFERWGEHELKKAIQLSSDGFFVG